MIFFVISKLTILKNILNEDKCIVPNHRQINMYIQKKKKTTEK